MCKEVRWGLRCKALIAFTVAPPKGFSDSYGWELRKRRFVEAVFRNEGYKKGFEEIETPILESVAALPRSVFSVWNDNNFFGLDINDYDAAGTLLRTTKSVLRPEGTLPVCRFVATQLAEGQQIPNQLLYSIACYRNEPIEEVDGYKKREFRQLGVEYIDDKGIESDAAVIEYAYNVMRAIGIPQQDIRVRLNNVQVFNDLCEESNLRGDDKIELQRALDAFSKERALENANSVVLPKTDDLSAGLRQRWKQCAGDYLVLPEAKRLNRPLGDLAGILQERNVPVTIDLAVVRGFNYYTGCVFQIDVRQGTWLAEIGGGGRYDEVIGQYLRDFGIERPVPATGFAFGTERLVKAARLQGTYTLELNL